MAEAISLITDGLHLDDREERTDLISNFKKIEKALGDLNDFITQIKGTVSKADVEKELADFKDKLEKEIQAIILPDNPAELEQEFEAAKTDSKGIVHASLAERFNAELSYIEDEIKSESGTDDSSDQDTLKGFPVSITDAGLISVDFIKKSSLMHAKKIGIIGDSVAQGSHAAYNFGTILNKATGAEIQNLAVGGAHLSDNGSTAIVNQANKLFNCDVVIIQGTDDDWLASIPIGTTDDNVDNTYIGALRKTIETVRNNNPSPRLIAMTATLQTPLNGDGTIKRTDRTKNNLGLTLHDYMNAEKTALSYWGIPYVDFMKTDGIFDPTNPAFRKKMMSEGLHPNEIGHQYIAQEIAKSFYWYYG